MAATITVFDRSPDGGRGLARDTRVRWALEEVGEAYDVQPITFPALKEAAHLARNPFGQIPTLEDGELTLFETGAIVLHLAERHPGTLLPTDPDGRVRAITWMFAAVNSVEPGIIELFNAQLLERDHPWSAERLPLVKERARGPLRRLAASLGEKLWLEGDAFTAGDLMMVHVLLRFRPAGVLGEFPTLGAYVARGEARPAYRRAFAAQHAFNNRSE